MKDPRIVFMGTPEFGGAILRELLEEGRNVVGVVCQPDKLVGRKQVLTFPPVKTVNCRISIGDSTERSYQQTQFQRGCPNVRRVQRA